jgi:Tol biopolymer transport system component
VSAHRKKRNINRFHLLVIRLVVVFALSIGSTILVVRLASGAEYSCLNYLNPDYWDMGFIIVDTVNGKAMRERRPIVARRPSMLSDARGLSPDGKYYASLRGNMTHHMAIEQLSTGKMAILQKDMSGASGWAWSPDGTHLAYMWQDLYGETYLSTVRPNGGIKKTISVGKSPRGFHGWSGDGKYLALSLADSSTYAEYIDVFSAYDLQLVSSSMLPAHAQVFYGNFWRTYDRKIVWSPQGHRFAYLWTQDKTTYLTLFSHDENINKTFVARDVPQQQDVEIRWLPDNQYVAVQNLLGGLWQVSLFSVSGEVHEDVTEVSNLFLGDVPPFPRPIWSADRRMLAFVKWNTYSSGDLKVFRLEDGTTQTLATNITYHVANEAESRRIAAVIPQDAHYAVPLMDLDGKNPVRAVTNALQVSKLLWSPNGRSIAIAWKTGDERHSAIKITLLRADGTQRREITSSASDVFDLQWSGDSQSVVYITEKHNKLALDALNYEQIDSIRLLSDASKISALSRDAATGWLTFFWANPQGQLGAGFYKPGSQTAYLFEVSQRIETIETIVWSSPSSYAGFMLRWDANIYPSPKGQAAVVTSGTIDLNSGGLPASTKSDIRVEFSSNGKNPARVLRTGLNSLGTPTWSPDGRQFAFVQHNTPQHYVGSDTLEILDESGNDKWRLTPSSYYDILTWSACE